jgi:hypothetical protein
MNEPPIIAGLAVNILVPLLGIVVYVLFCRKMLSSGVEMPPVFSYFLLFAIYGAWLIVILTGFFWEWSGMASLGVFFLLLIAPFLTGGSALILRGRRRISLYHRCAFALSGFYSCVLPLAFATWIVRWFLEGH